MSTPDTVPSFVVVAEAADGNKQDLGVFFRVVDADKFMAGLTGTGFRHARIEPRDMPAADVHPAHQSLFPKTFPQSAPSKK